MMYVNKITFVRFVFIKVKKTNLEKKKLTQINVYKKTKPINLYYQRICMGCHLVIYILYCKYILFEVSGPLVDINI